MKRRLPSFRGIEAFAVMGEVLNLKRAAEQLNITVSAVSHRLQALEDELGMRLFDRGTRGMTLTKEGAMFFEALKPGLQSLHDATDFTKTRASKVTIRISAPPVFYTQWLFGRLPDFSRAHPEIEFELLTLGRRRGAICDVTIGPLTASTARAGAKPFFDLILSPVCHPGYAIEHGLKEPADLARARLLEVTSTPEGWRLWLAAAGLSMNMAPRTLVVDNQSLVYEAAASSIGVALGARFLVEDEIDQGRLMRPFDVECRAPSGMGLHVAKSSAPVRAFATWLQDEIASSIAKYSTRAPILSD